MIYFSWANHKDLPKHVLLHVFSLLPACCLFVVELPETIVKAGFNGFKLKNRENIGPHHLQERNNDSVVIILLVEAFMFEILEIKMPYQPLERY